MVAKQGSTGVDLDSLEHADGWAAAHVPIQDDPVPAEARRGEARDMLTAKQREVLDLLIEHKTSKEISRLLGISPHTVDQRIMLARAKLNVASRSEVAQAYRRLVEAERKSSASTVYEQPVYGFSHVATEAADVHSSVREGGVANDRPLSVEEPGHAPVALSAGDSGQPYYHVLPEMFDGPNGTVLRLGAIVLIVVFLILVVMGGLAMFAQLSQMIDR